MTSVFTRRDLLEQSIESRERNISYELSRQLEMQFDVMTVDDRDRLADMGLSGTVTDRLAKIIERVFPFVTDGKGLIQKAQTFGDLVRLILAKVGA